jgi:hypothetical protein
MSQALEKLRTQTQLKPSNGCSGFPGFAAQKIVNTVLGCREFADPLPAGGAYPYDTDTFAGKGQSSRYALRPQIEGTP